VSILLLFLFVWLLDQKLRWYQKTMSMKSSISNIKWPRSAAQQQHQQQDQYEAQHMEPEMSQYKMNHTVKAVPKLWQEWDVGYSRCIPVKEIEADPWVHSWRKDERKFFNIRKQGTYTVGGLVTEKSCGDLQAVRDLEFRSRSHGWELHTISYVRMGCHI
jgi:hypothetical protein